MRRACLERDATESQTCCRSPRTAMFRELFSWLDYVPRVPETAADRYPNPAPTPAPLNPSLGYHLMRTRPALLALSLLAVHALAAQTVRDSVISVSAFRNSRVAADRASLYLVVDGTAETATDAVARVETKLKSVTEALKTFGTRIEIDKPLTYSVGATPSPNGFPGPATPASNIARAIIHVAQVRPAEVATLVAAALNAGAASSSALNFESSVADSVRRARMAEVFAVAHADAEALAKVLGGRLGALVDVTSNSGQSFQQPVTLNFDNRFPNQTATPEVPITTTVIVRYRVIR